MEEQCIVVDARYARLALLHHSTALCMDGQLDQGRQGYRRMECLREQKLGREGEDGGR